VLAIERIRAGSAGLAPRGVIAGAAVWIAAMLWMTPLQTMVWHDPLSLWTHIVYVQPARNLEVLQWLRDAPEHRYDFLQDLTAVDYGGGREIQVVYQLWSIPNQLNLRVKCELPLQALEIDSVYHLWRASDWLEREVYDMFGVVFNGHPDLRRILMPEDWPGHPLRKDFVEPQEYHGISTSRESLLKV